MIRRPLKTTALLAAMSIAAATPSFARAQNEYTGGVVEPTLASAKIQPADEHRDDEKVHVLAEFIKTMMQFGANAAATPGKDVDFNICLSKKSDTRHQLSELDSEVFNGRQVHVNVVSDPTDITSDCGLAFIAGGEVDDVDYRELSRENVLTMSDSYDFARRGGILEIAFVGNHKIAFFVQGRQIRDTELAPSSKFLRYATAIY